MINRLTTEYVTEYEEVSPRFDLIENVGRHAVNPRGDFNIIVNMWRTISTVGMLSGIHVCTNSSLVPPPLPRGRFKDVRKTL